MTLQGLAESAPHGGGAAKYYQRLIRSLTATDSRAGATVTLDTRS